MPDPRVAFLALSRHFLLDDFLRKLERALALVDDDTVWWRPHPACNSIGNLLLHLAGNVRQWIVSGVGGAPDVRRRQEEFDATGPIPREELLSRLRTAVQDAGEALRLLPADRLLERRLIQGNDVSILEAVYHVVEHFSMHTGQILYIVKMRTGQDLGFYAVTPDGNARMRWNTE